ncbi:translation initiation factor IF-5A [Candidatus Pacearchaeota archaeon]|nr:translation initiation factor IF-5A [Candidatus Pacearchaeota archaeon]
MPIKMVYVTELREGNYVIIEGVPCIVRNIEISKTGKHGHSKARFDAIGLIDNKKRVVLLPGHEKLDVPLVEKKRGQVLSIREKASIMDLESFETIEIAVPDDLKEEIKEGVQVEYWDVEGQKVIKRVMGSAA